MSNKGDGQQAGCECDFYFLFKLFIPFLMDSEWIGFISTKASTKLTFLLGLSLVGIIGINVRTSLYRVNITNHEWREMDNAIGASKFPLGTHSSSSELQCRCNTPSET